MFKDTQTLKFQGCVIEDALEEYKQLCQIIDDEEVKNRVHNAIERHFDDILDEILDFFYDEIVELS